METFVVIVITVSLTQCFYGKIACILVNTCMCEYWHVAFVVFTYLFMYVFVCLIVVMFRVLS